MTHEGKKTKNGKIVVSEMNNQRVKTKRRVDFSVQSQNTKPYDINKMTGNSSSNNESKE